MSRFHRLATAALRTLDAETAHTLALRALKLELWHRDPTPPDPILATELAGLALQNPVGLAAGFDKDARVYHEMAHAGFGFLECGTVTPLPQPGSPRPRLFRLPQDRAVINRMGFNNEGLEAFAGRITPWTYPQRPGWTPPRPPAGARRKWRSPPLVANIGANKDSVDRVGDYVTGLRRLWRLADAITVNVSSPNTPGLRGLQTAAALDELGERMAAARARLRAERVDPDFDLDSGDLQRQDVGAGPPLFLKVAPDLDAAEIEAISDRAVAHGFDALIVSNTTVERLATLRSRHAGEAGGLSGAPLFARSTQVLAEFAQALAGSGLPLVGVGGVASGADAYAKIRAGACAVQLYTALVYAGPALVGEIKRDLAARLRADGFVGVRDAVGAH